MMMVSSTLAVDTRALDSLKHQAARSAPAALKEAARQFEALFMQELVKSMRQASMESGLLQGSEGHLARDLYDQQLALQMSGRSGGLSEAIERQLTRQLDMADAASSAPPSTLSLARGEGLPATPHPFPSVDAGPGVQKKQAQGRDQFVFQHRTAAEKVARESGIPAHFMLGQAGHETGWGKHLIRHKDGSPAYNLFGIKADKHWHGPVAEITTTEYIHGTPRKFKARFRAYGSWEESFRDYARFIAKNPRYAQARAITHSPRAWADALQRAGYATDPHYANKLSRSIESTLAALRTLSPSVLA